MTADEIKKATLAKRRHRKEKSAPEILSRGRF